jgi:hypothetical protein
MNIRRIEKGDLEDLYFIHEAYHNFPFPDLSNPLYAVQRIIEDDGKIIMAGIVKLTTEGIFIVNKERNPLTITRAIKMMLEQLTKDCEKIGLNETHVFVENDDNFINIMRKLKFQDTTGHSMVFIK